MTKQVKYEITYGISSDKNREYICIGYNDEQSLYRMILGMFDGFSLHEHSGLYKHSNGMIVKEKSRTITIICVDNLTNSEYIDTIITRAIKMYRQEAVLVTKTNVTSELVKQIKEK